ncbi:hypothetical protein AWB79_04749 [Caballeronia hypogeia]|uniref:Uncharacterized protein n=1 Tax=Caballeronia hypogeia TaxID=1777140 RepID=A0A158C577_9BURK|nr:hypothetical protein [Caballeronia hypogeia]SAK77430.1 hypothetical protein AWB79_04749 [Caballeronia hypogeia]
MPHHAELPPEESIAEHPSPANDPNVINLHEPTLEFQDEPAPARTPLRFGRLALWMASASALGIGVLGTVAYSMWFNHDQRVYAEAMSSARKTLGIDQPAIAAQTQSAGAVETPLTVPPGYVNPTASNDGSSPVDTAALADNPPPPETGDEPALAAASPSVEGDGDGGATTATSAAALAMAATQDADGAQTAPSAQSVAAQRRGNPSATQQVAGNHGNSAAQARRRAAHASPAAKPEGGLFARVGAFFHRVSYRHNVPNRQREEYSRP